MGFIHGHAARVIEVSSEESRRVSNAKTHNFPFLRAGRFREGFPGSATSGRAKKVTNGEQLCLVAARRPNIIDHLGRRCRRYSNLMPLKTILSVPQISVPFLLIDLRHAPWVFHGGVLRAPRAASFVKMCGEGLIGRESN
jgi:hypothetical protein